MNEKELIAVEDIFENDELVLTKVTYTESDFEILETVVGLKDATGDVVRMVTVDKKCK